MFKCTIHRNGWQQRKKFPQTSRSWSSPSVGGRLDGRRFQYENLEERDQHDDWRGGKTSWDWCSEQGQIPAREDMVARGCEEGHARPRLGERWTVELRGFFQRRTTAFKFSNICKSQTITLYLWEWNANIILRKIIYLSFHLSTYNE